VTTKYVYDKVQTFINHYLGRMLKWQLIWTLGTKSNRNKLQSEFKRDEGNRWGTLYLKGYNSKTKKKNGRTMKNSIE
jgi:hypothetical protein